MTLSFSVIIPAHNSARFIADAIGSVRAQQVPALEIIVVDDGSTDDTPAIALAHDPAVRVIRLEKRGVSAARNAGFAASTGEAIVFLDADDLLPEGTLRAYSGFLEQHPNIDAVGGYLQLVSLLGASGQAEHAPNMVRNMPLLTLQIGCMAFRRALVEAVGDFDETLALSEDVDWHLRADEAGVRRAFLHRITLHYRRHPKNVTQTTEADVIRRTYFEVLRRAAERRSDPGLLGRLYPDWEPLLVPLPEEPLRVSAVLAIGPGEGEVVRLALAGIAEQVRLPDELVIVASSPPGALVSPSSPLAQRIRWVASDSTGAEAYNVGIAAASHEAIAPLRPVDRWRPGYLAAQHEMLRRYPVCDYHASAFERIAQASDDPSGARLSEFLSTLLVRRRAFDRVGLFYPAYPLAFDLDWATRAEDAAVPFFRGTDPLVEVQLVGGAALAAFYREILHIRRASIGRRASERRYQPQ